jgi:hypothetical protein
MGLLSVRGLGKMISLSVALGVSTMAAGCNVDYSDVADDSLDGSEGVDGATLSMDAATASDESSELGTSQQGLWFFNRFGSESSCSDTRGTNSVMAALAVATATELHRWQPTKDFTSSGGMLKLSSTGKAQCADGRCWNTQAILDLQSAPSGKIQVRPGVPLDSSALRSTLTSNLTRQLFSLSSLLVPEHRLELLYSASGGCDQYYWFNVTSSTGGFVSNLLTSLEKKLTWVGGDDNPYVQFQSSGTMVGIDPTYGLNEAGSTATGSCSAACTRISSSNITGSCCSCNGTKTFARSAWSTATYICQ